MKHEDPLFELIHSLSRFEKMHFKIAASRRNGEKKYLLLFDAIDRQQQYDEKAIRRKFHKEDFIRQLPVAKNYLQQAILRSLRHFHSENNLENELREGIHSIEILYNKGLYRQADRLCKRLLKKAEEGERYMRQLELLRLQRMIQRIQGYPQLSAAALDAAIQEEETVFLKMKNGWDYDLLSDQYFILATHSEYLSPEQKNKLEKLLTSPLLKNEKQALSTKALTTYYRISSRIYHNLGQAERSQELANKLILLYENLPPAQFAEERYNYIIILYNQLILLTHLKKTKDFEKALARLRGIKATNNKERITLFYTYLTELDFYIAVKRYDAGLRLEAPITAGLQLYEGKMNVQVECSMCFNLCVVMIRTGNFSAALRWANRIINSSRYHTVDDFYYATRLLYLIIHYELGNYDTLVYLAESTDRYLKKQAYYGQLEEVLLSFLSRRLPECTSAKEKLAELRLLRKKIAEAAELPGADKSLHYFDFSGWVEDKLKAR